MNLNDYHKIYLFDSPFDSESVLKICNQIDEANDNPHVTEIMLVINSGGGNYDCMALYDYIQASPKPIDTLACGHCGSAAVTVLQAGRKRFATKNSTILVHQGRGGSSSEDGEQLSKSQSKKWETRYLIMRKITADRIGMSLEEYLEYISVEKVLTTDEAFEKKFIDEIV
jgi:ATP-dependent protease ClpP protease subunit